jgi:hypothetical protein
MSATHRDKLDAAAAVTFARHTEHGWQELLTADEERYLAHALPQLAAFAEQLGVAQKRISDWSREEMMRFLALAVRAAVPLRSLSDHHSYREFSDEIPFP